MRAFKGGVLLVPYVGEFPEAAVAALEGAERYGWVICPELIGSGPGDYGEVLMGNWSLCSIAQTDLLIVEGDVVIHRQVFDQFEECPNEYCVFSYWLGASYGYGLGCTRFRARLIHEHPDLIRAAGKRQNDGIPIDYHFRRMDTRIRDEAKDRGLLYNDFGGHFSPCLHEPYVRHLHKYPMMDPLDPEAAQWRLAEFREKYAGGSPDSADPDSH